MEPATEVGPRVTWGQGFDYFYLRHSLWLSDNQCHEEEFVVGQEYGAVCKCGLNSTIFVGSSRAQRGKVFDFPHYCISCGSVVTVDILNKPHTCPKCGSAKVKRYGIRIFEFPYPWSLRVIWVLSGWWIVCGFQDMWLQKARNIESFCYSNNSTYGLRHGHQYCPRCNEKGLYFVLTAMFD